MSDLIKSFLEVPALFNSFSALVGTQKAFKRIVKEADLQTNSRVLDIGCGFGGLLEQLPAVEYLGFDSNNKYIKYAAQRYKNRGKFICNTVNSENLAGQPSFDLVVAYGVVHHLDDTEATKLFQLAYSALKTGGQFISVDPVLYDKQGIWKKWLASNDRGKFVRREEEYLVLARSTFKSIEVKIVEDWIYIPASLLVIKGQKA